MDTATDHRPTAVFTEAEAIIRACRFCGGEIPAFRSPRAIYCREACRRNWEREERRGPVAERAPAKDRLAAAIPVKRFCRCGKEAIIFAEPDFIRCFWCGHPPPGRRR